MKYRLIDLGTLGGNDALANGLNDKGEIVGTSSVKTGVFHAFLFSNGSMTDIATNTPPEGSTAWGINDIGTVVGTITTNGKGDNRPFVYSKSSLRYLGTLGGSYSEPHGINSRGHVVGLSYNEHHNKRPVMWIGGTIKDLGSLGGNEGEALSINNSDVVVGMSYLRDNTKFHAFIRKAERCFDVGTLGGDNSKAEHINARGEFVGSADTPDGSRHAFLYRNGKMHDLSTLGGSSSNAFSINDHDEIVGQSQTKAGNLSAFVIKDDRLFDLDTITIKPEGWHITLASGINNKGWIVGSGYINKQQRSCILVPISAQRTK